MTFKSDWDSLMERKPSINNLMQDEKGVDILEWYFRCVKTAGDKMQDELINNKTLIKILYDEIDKLKEPEQ